MDLREYIRKYQGKYFKNYNEDNITYMRIIKVKETPKELQKYTIIGEYVFLHKNGKYDYFTYPGKFSKLVVPTDIGWVKITKIEYMNVLRKSQEYKN